MAVLFIDTAKVDAVSDNIETISGKCSTLLSSVEGYDVSCEGGFDFSGAKSALVNNLKGAETKFKNTVALLTAVVNLHGGIQNSVSGTGGDVSATPVASSGNNYNYSGGNYSGGSYSGGTYETYSPSTSSTPVFTADTTTSNLSALQTLQATTDTGAEQAIALNTLIKVDDVLKKIDVEEISVSDIEKISRSKNTIIVEGISSSEDCAKYLVDVSEVASKYDVAVKYIRLDKVIEDPNAATSDLYSTAKDLIDVTKEKIVDIYNSVTNHRRDYTVQYSDDWCAAFVSAVLIKAGYSEYSNILDPGVGKMQDGFEENNMYEEATSTTKPTPGSVIFLKDTDGSLSHVGIVEYVDDDGTIHTIEGNYDGSKVVRVSERKVGDSTIAGYGVLRKSTSSSKEEKILDETAYKKLTTLNSTNEIKLKDTPITLIIKEDKVVNSLQGVVSKTKLESAIKAAGISQKSVAVQV